MTKLLQKQWQTLTEFQKTITVIVTTGLLAVLYHHAVGSGHWTSTVLNCTLGGHLALMLLMMILVDGIEENKAILYTLALYSPVILHVAAFVTGNIMFNNYRYAPLGAAALLFVIHLFTEEPMDGNEYLEADERRLTRTLGIVK